LHDRWISYRFLAERLRSGYFLATAGTGTEADGRPGLPTSRTHPRIDRTALTEVVARRPELDIGPSQLAALRSIPTRYWIGSQISCHQDAASVRRRSGEGFIRATEPLFFLTLIAVFVHMPGISHKF
jgi:hypothetical protein